MTAGFDGSTARNGSTSLFRTFVPPMFPSSPWQVAIGLAPETCTRSPWRNGPATTEPVTTAPRAISAPSAVSRSFARRIPTTPYVWASCNGGTLDRSCETRHPQPGAEGHGRGFSPRGVPSPCKNHSSSRSHGSAEVRERQAHSVHKDLTLAAARPADDAGRGGARGACRRGWTRRSSSPAAAGWLHRRSTPGARASGTRRSRRPGSRSAARTRPAAHVRDRGARRRHLDVRVVAADGHVDRDDRPPLRAPDPRRRGVDAGSPRRESPDVLAFIWRRRRKSSE